MKARDEWFAFITAELKSGSTILSTDAPAVNINLEHGSHVSAGIESLIISEKDTDGSGASILKALLESISPLNTTPLGIQRRDRVYADLASLYSSYIINTTEISFDPTPSSDLPVLDMEASNDNPKALLFLAHLRSLMSAIGPSRLFSTWWKPALKPIISQSKSRPLFVLAMDIVLGAVQLASSIEAQDLALIGEVLINDWILDREEVWQRATNPPKVTTTGDEATEAGSVNSPFWVTFRGSNLELIVLKFARLHTKVNEWLRIRLHTLVSF
jgi:hypothetical protein